MGSGVRVRPGASALAWLGLAEGGLVGCLGLRFRRRYREGRFLLRLGLNGRREDPRRLLRRLGRCRGLGYHGAAVGAEFLAFLQFGAAAGAKCHH